MPSMATCRSKFEAGQLTLSLDDYSIKDVVHNVFTVVEPLATEKSLALKVELPNDLPTAHGDERRLTQVLLNLVGNAIKFTNSGEVLIKAAASNGAYTLSVRDTGPGIDRADQVKIFEEFHKLTTPPPRRRVGRGSACRSPGVSSPCMAVESGSSLSSVPARRFSSTSRTMSNSKWGTHDQTHSCGRGPGG